MGLLNWIADRLSSYSTTSQPLYKFTEQDRDKAISARKARNETIQLEERLRQEEIMLEMQVKKEELLTRIAEAKARREDLYDDIAEDEDNSGSVEDKIFMKLLEKAMPSHSQAVAVPPTSVSPNTTTASEITDEQIKQYVASIPKHKLKLAKKLDNDGLKTQILNVVPNASSADIERIMIQIRNN